MRPHKSLVNNMKIKPLMSFPRKRESRFSSEIRAEVWIPDQVGNDKEETLFTRLT